MTVVHYAASPGGSGTAGYQDFALSPCFGEDCDYALNRSIVRTGELINAAPTATSWFAQGWGTQWIDRASGLPDPIASFDLGDSANLVLMTVWAANTSAPGSAQFPAQLPASALSFVSLVTASPGSLAAVSPELNLIGSSVSVQLSPAPSARTLLGDVSFAGSNDLAIPEMATGLMVLGGFIVGGCLRRKRVR